MYVLPLDQVKVLYDLSKLGLLTGTIGILCGFPGLGTGVCIGSVFAQLYWADPVYGWRRTLDMAWVQLLIWSHLWAVWGTPAHAIYLAIQALGVAFYAGSWVLQTSGWTRTSIGCHAAVHLCANLSLLFFYLSSVLPGNSHRTK